MTNPNDPAVPINPHDKVETWLGTGLTKREYFAAMAMQSLVVKGPPEIQHLREHEVTGAEWIAKNALVLADVLIEELNRI